MIVNDTRRGIVRRCSQESRIVASAANVSAVIGHSGRHRVVVGVRMQEMRRRMRVVRLLLRLEMMRMTHGPPNDVVVMVMMMMWVRMMVMRMETVLLSPWMVMRLLPAMRGLSRWHLVVRVTGHGRSVHQHRRETRFRVDSHRLHDSRTVNYRAVVLLLQMLPMMNLLLLLLPVHP